MLSLIFFLLLYELEIIIYISKGKIVFFFGKKISSWHLWFCTHIFSWYLWFCTQLSKVAHFGYSSPFSDVFCGDIFLCSFCCYELDIIYCCHFIFYQSSNLVKHVFCVSCIFVYHILDACPDFGCGAHVFECEKSFLTLRWPAMLTFISFFNKSYFSWWKGR